jgi:hypothetical protein
MGNATLNTRELAILQKTITQTISFFASEDLSVNNTSFGSVLISMADDTFVEIKNNYFNSQIGAFYEEITKYEIHEIKSLDNYKPAVPKSNLLRSFIDEQIIDVTIMRDTISKVTKNPSDNFTFIVDSGIIFEFADSRLIIYQETDVMPLNSIYYGPSDQIKLPSIDLIKDNWQNEDEPDNITIQRQLLSLKEYM